MTDLAPVAPAPAGPEPAPPPAPPVILLVDDEPNVLSALQRALRPDGYRVLTARNGLEGVEVLNRETVAVIVSDQRMARMAGTEFLEAARALQPDAVRLMLTGYAEPQAIMDAINRGQVYRFITKPWEDGDLRLTLRRAADQYQLVQENRRLTAQVQAQNAVLAQSNQLLERRVAERTAEVTAQRDLLQTLYGKLDTSFAETIRVFASLLELRDSNEGSHARRVAATARFIAEHLKLEPAEVRDVEIAATLHDIGKLSLPDSLRVKAETGLTGPERAMIQRHPVVGQVLLGGIEALQTAGLMICHHHERYDGLGYPNKLAGAAIPLGARIIAVANAYDRLVYARDETVKRTAASALDELARQATFHFDPQVVLALAAYLQHLSREQTQTREVRIALSLVRPKMVLARDLQTAKGRLLMARDTPLSASFIERVRNYARMEDLGPVYIWVTGADETLYRE